jgi:hypothetical protein
VATAIVGEVSRRDTEGTSPARPLRVRWIRAGTRAQLREVRRRQLNPGPLRDDADSVDRSLPESIRDWSETTGPAAPRHTICGLDNVVLLPHTGGATVRSLSMMRELACRRLPQWSLRVEDAASRFSILMSPQLRGRRARGSRGHTSDT